jgi:hypothetical protein
MTLLQDGKPSEEIERYLQGISFPALKHDVIHAARRADAPSDVVAMLEQIPVTKFESKDHLLRSYGEAV